MADEMLSGNDAPLVFEASVPSTNDVAIDAALGGVKRLLVGAERVLLLR